jgi:1,4-dihydroxy-2-naphthoyl-CoA hydrolase
VQRLLVHRRERNRCRIYSSAVSHELSTVLEVSPFDRHYGLEVVDAGDEVVHGRVQVRRELTQPVGLVHGGVYASIAEALASLGTNVGVSGEGNLGLGMSNHSTFLRPVRDGTIHAEARRRHRGRTTWVWDVDLTDDQGRLCATSRVTIAVRPLEP